MKRFALTLIAMLLWASACMAEGQTTGTQRVLTDFHYSHGGYDMPQSYEIYRAEDGYYLREDDGDPRRIDEAWVADIQRTVEDCDLISWDGFSESEPYMLDGEGFSLDLAFSDGVAVHATGDNAFPDGYFDAIDRIEEVFRQEKRALIAGTYRYEGEGFGGDFTITLNADGTYSFYEGYLSSYMGGGEWEEYRGTICMTERSGLDLRNMLGYEDGALLFVAEDSDGFPYVQVPDGGRFLRLDPEEATEDGDPYSGD